MCAEQGIALRGHRDQNSLKWRRKNSDTERRTQIGNFKWIRNIINGTFRKGAKDGIIAN